MSKFQKDIREILDIPKIDKLLQKFTATTGTVTALLDLNGKILTASGWQPICTEFFRKNPYSAKNCLESDTHLANMLKRDNKDYNLYKCKNGLIDVAVPVKINSQHLANLFIGQFLFEKPDIDFFESLARKYRFEREAFMDALQKVTITTEEEVNAKINFLLELSSFIGEMGLNKLKLENMNQSLKKKISQIKDSQIKTVKMMQDAEEARKEAEELNRELDKMITELKDSNEQLERFAYVASHDLQEPLRKVNSFTQLFERRYSELVDEKGQKYIYYIKDGTIRMQQLINDLLDFSRINTRGKEFEKISTQKIAGEIKELFSTKLKETKGSLTVGELPDIYGDESQIRQLFQNLIGNAIKFRKKDVPPEISIKAEKKDSYWFFKVKDNGIGIKEEFKDRIFIIFQRLHSREAYEGTGIGLALCRQIVKRHGGEITFSSKPEEGTEFVFSIPVKKQKAKKVDAK